VGEFRKKDQHTLHGFIVGGDWSNVVKMRGTESGSSSARACWGGPPIAKVINKWKAIRDPSGYNSHRA